MDKQFADNISSVNTWLRLAYMVLFGFILYFAFIAISLIATVQFLHVLFSGKRQEKLAGIASQLNAYMRQNLDFVTFISEEKPFPFSDFPQAGGSNSSAEQDSEA